MALTTYDLPNVASLPGTFKIRLYSSSAALTVPTVDTVLEIGDLVESADSASSFVEISTLQLVVRDDYSTHSEGFWYKLLSQTTTEVRVFLDEGSGDTFYFYGKPSETAVTWEEKSLAGGGYIRIGSITLVSIAKSILDTPTSTWVTETAGDGLGVDFGNATDSGERNDVHPMYYISLLNAFDSMLAAAGLNSYASGDTSFVYDTADLRFIYSATNYRVDQLYLCTHYYDGGGAIAVLCDYWASSANADSFNAQFSTLGSLLEQLLPNIGCVMRMNYDTGTGRHKIQLVQRGRAYAAGSNLVFSSKEKTSTISKAYELLIDATRATFLLQQDTPINTYHSVKYSPGGTQNTAPPDYIDFGRDMLVLFRCNDGTGDFAFGGGPPATSLSRFFYVLISGQLEPITDMEYYNYATDSFSSVAGSTMEAAVAGYFYYRFATNFTSITRSYGAFAISDGSTTTHTNVSIYRRTSINDGTGAATYYANRITKSPMKNEIEIEWILE